MRIIAALMVFFFHALYQYPFRDEGAADVYHALFGQGGWTGVGFFFVLSGFVLTWSMRPNDTFRRFWRRRFFKIFPNHLVTYVAAGAILLWLGQSLGGWKAVANLLLLHAWFPQLEVETSVNPVSWSLSVEFLFYASFPLLIRVVDKIRPRHLWYAAGAVIAVIMVMPMVAWAVPDEPRLWFAGASEWQFWAVYVLPLTRVLDFTLGMLLARIVQRGQWIRLGLAPAMALVVAAYALSYQVGFTYGLVAVMVVPLALMIAAGADADVNGRWSPLRSPAMVWLGNVSFAFYLWHQIVLTELHRALGGLTQNWNTAGALGYIALAFTVTLLLAWALYSLVEEPVMKRWSKPRRRAAVPSTVVLTSEQASRVTSAAEPVLDRSGAGEGPRERN
ncbi:acyltransferase family protein [Streptomyces sp. NPDC001595]|uniref:acyltransferase family protein n=1 Tax=Streptomyces sp. NPDC001532 TaxID=3154520 RepID=UPI0033320E42